MIAAVADEDVEHHAAEQLAQVASRGQAVLAQLGCDLGIGILAGGDLVRSEQRQRRSKRQAGAAGAVKPLDEVNRKRDERTYGPPRLQVGFCDVLISLRQRIRSHGRAHGQDGHPRV